MRVVYEDNHIIVVYKESGEIVQGDKTGDVPLSDIVKGYIKEKYQKPGNVFLGVVHRLDRPVYGLVLFARTSKALPRLNKMFQNKEGEEGVKKTYWAIVPKAEEKKSKNAEVLPDGFTRLTHWLSRNEKQNKSYAYDSERHDTKKAILEYKIIGSSDRYQLVEIRLLTGRHHQIRCQLAKIGLPIKGDLKYGAPRSNPNGSISLLSRKMEFIHPVSKEPISITAPLPDDKLWKAVEP
ncbi:RluA family pseudouridine synthase [Palleniella muris]|uniref:RluA family pseudouridine synthase n=1 Tax=Palleniella muris TaxID=3038145 RepID=A0AC61QR96_9BACT|nr:MULTISPECIES: RluA family pseudouridine synthase [Palleniella]NPD81033.1 RluA family pseudouridine synthase [Palleniella intestinalis]TGX82619.1 RluA family pseudouridine synthase [Palleniella muris]